MVQSLCITVLASYRYCSKYCSEYLIVFLCTQLQLRCVLRTDASVTSYVGSTVYQCKFCQILRTSSQNSTAHSGKIVQILWLTAALHLCISFILYKKKLQFLDAGIALSYARNKGNC